MFYSQSTHPIPFSTFKNIKVKFAKVQKCKSSGHGQCAKNAHYLSPRLLGLSAEFKNGTQISQISQIVSLMGRASK